MDDSYYERKEFVAEIQGYYDGTVSIPLERGKLQTDQEVLIIVPGEKIPSLPHRLGTLGKQLRPLWR